MLSVRGILALQYATVIMGIPFAIVPVLVMVGLAKALRIEAMREDSRAGFVPGLLSRRGGYPDRDGSLCFRGSPGCAGCGSRDGTTPAHSCTPRSGPR